MMAELVMSMNIPPTRGTTKKALGAGPYWFLMASMLAMALGVAPMPKPQMAAVMTAAHEGGVQVHEQGLNGQDHHDGQSQSGQLPQHQGHQGDAQEDVQAGVAGHVDGLQGQLLAHQVGNVTDDQGHQHAADVHGQGDVDGGEGVGHIGAQAGGDDDEHKGGEEGLAVEHLGLGLIDGLRLAQVGVLLHLAGQGLQAVLLDLPAAQRSAHQGAGHQAVGGAGDGHRGGALHAHVLEQGAEGGGGAVAAHQGDGAHAQAQTAVQTKHAGQAHAHQVLADDQDGGQDQEEDHRPGALLQQLDAGAEADAGEEEGEGQDPGLIGDQVQDGEDQSADDRCGDAAALEELHVTDREASQQEQQHCQRRRLQHVQ